MRSKGGTEESEIEKVSQVADLGRGRSSARCCLAPCGLERQARLAKFVRGSTNGKARQ